MKAARPGKWIVLFPDRIGYESGHAPVREVEAAFPEEALERSGAWKGWTREEAGPGIEDREDGGYEWDDHWVYPPGLRHVAAEAVLQSLLVDSD